MRVCDIEMDKEMAMKTLDLLKAIKVEYPDKEFVFAAGSDLYWGISGQDPAKAWEQDEARRKELGENCDFIIVERPGYELPEVLPKNFKLAAPVQGTIFSSQEMSSSEVRKRVKTVNYGDREKETMVKGDLWMVDGLIPSSVLAHINRYNLYKQ